MVLWRGLIEVEEEVIDGDNEEERGENSENKRCQ